MRHARLALATSVVLFAAACAERLTDLRPSAAEQRAHADSGWEAAGGGYDNIRYSPLTEITTDNVHLLEEVWRYDTGDAFPGSEMQTNPLVIGRMLYAVSPKQRVIALDAGDGRLIWSFDPLGGQDEPRLARHRGLTYWSGGGEGRIFYAVGPWLYALNAVSGRPVETFGEGGRIDLREGLGRDPRLISVSATSPGVIYRDLLILGSSLAEDLPAAPGDIRAFDVRTGAIRWTFRTIPEAGEAGTETWPENARETSGGANSWAGLSLDAERGLVFVPTGSAAFDFWGGDRPGDNLYANSLVALDAATGRRVWHFQTVRHDIWDRDLPAPPSLITIRRDGKAVDALAQITKAGRIWLFDRATGRPLVPFEEVPVPESDVPGETMAATQPLPLSPPPFSRQRFDRSQVTDRTADARAAVLEQLDSLRFGHPFEPPSLQGTVIFPGLDGGGEWGGAAFDPETRLLYVNSNEMPWILRLLPRGQSSGKAVDARSLYLANCAGCHGADLAGSPGFPSLRMLPERLTRAQAERTIAEGASRMPAFAGLGQEAVSALAHYLMTGEARVVSREGGQANRLPFRLEGYRRFLDPEGYPAIAPPWGQLTAIDLERGEIRWQIPFGEYPELLAQGLRDTGSENYGGPVVTAGGLLFIGATTVDRKFRAFDKATGKLLWETLLPASATATPAVYQVDGRQFVVIGAGGGKSGQPSGGTYVAFAIPRDAVRFHHSR